MHAPARALAAAAILGSLGAGALGAQAAPRSDSARILAATHAGQVTTESGGAVTAAIRVTNLSPDTLTVVPRVTAPSDWSTLLGNLPFTLEPREGDSWLVSMRMPTRAPAGRYVVQLAAESSTGRALLRDSLVVDVRPRRAVELALAERPQYAVSGTPYRAAFLLHNRGNVAATFALHATSSMRSALDAPRAIALAADESKLVRIGVRSVLTGPEAVDEVLELGATDLADTTVSIVASTRVTIVQRAGSADPMHTVASTLRLRASGSSTGVSPFELIGGGQLRDGGAEQLEFVMRGKPATTSPFGDREEYRVGLRGTHYRAQVGDAFYMASPLTSAGQRGFGGGLDVGDSTFGGGAYTQNFRFQLEPGSERGAFVRLGGDAEAGAPRLGFNFVDRHGGPLAGQIFSGSSKLHPLGDMVVDLEYADSRGPSGHGMARSARVSGGDAVHFDLGSLSADPTFAGTSRGAAYDYVNVYTQTWNSLQLSASGSRSRLRGVDTTIDYLQQLSNAMVELSYEGRLSLAYTSLTRSSGSLLFTGAESQHGVLARADQAVGLGRVWGTAEAGRANGELTGLHPYTQFSLGGSMPVGPHTISLYGETSSGAAVMRGADRLLTLGVDAQLQLAASTTFAVGGSDTRTFTPDGGYAQMDARVTHTLPTGASVSMRVRIGGRDIHEAAIGQKLAFLEYSMPLALPTGPSRAPGRVRGRVVDQATGRGVSGALVRLGPQAAITDDDGRVAFAGLPAGEYRLSLAQQLASGATVFNGNANIAVDSARRDPVRFDVAVEAAGTVSGSVRRMVLARTGIGAAADSLVDGGPLEGVSVALAGARDTVYRITDTRGAFQFTDVPSGTWTVIVMGDTPAQTQWEMESIPMVMHAGEQAKVAFRLVPRHRKVRIVSGDGIDESGGSL